MKKGYKANDSQNLGKNDVIPVYDKKLGKGAKAGKAENSMSHEFKNAKELASKRTNKQ